MEVNRDKKSARISLDVSPLFFHIISKLVQALVITYDETFQALAVEGGVLPPTPFLDPHPPTVEPRLCPLGPSLVWETEETSPKPAISIWRHRQSRSPKATSGYWTLLMRAKLTCLSVCSLIKCSLLKTNTFLAVNYKNEWKMNLRRILCTVITIEKLTQKFPKLLYILMYPVKQTISLTRIYLLLLLVSKIYFWKENLYKVENFLSPTAFSLEEVSLYNTWIENHRF
jgi:hypothetical protein